MAKVQVTLPPISQPLFDKSTGLVTDPWYTFFEDQRNRTGGDVDLIDQAGSDSQQALEGVQGAVDGIEALQANEIVAGRGLEGGGAIGGGVRLDAKQQNGWVASTGGGDKTAPYSKYVAPTYAAAPTMAEAQALANALQALSARYVALEAALFLNQSLRN